MTFDEFLGNCEKLANKIKNTGFRPDCIVGVARGGWIPSRVLSSNLGVKDLLSIGIKYTDESRTTLHPYSKPDPMPIGKHILLVEDCLESGKSLEAAVNLFSQENTVKSASLFITINTIYKSDYYLDTLVSPPTFPWE